MKDILLTVIGIVVGAFVTWYVSYQYYVKAGEDLTREAAQLRALSNTALLALQNIQNGRTKINLAKNENGNYTIMSVEVKGVELETKATRPATAAAEVKP